LETASALAATRRVLQPCPSHPQAQEGAAVTPFALPLPDGYQPLTLWVQRALTLRASKSSAKPRQPITTMPAISSS